MKLGDRSTEAIKSIILKSAEVQSILISYLEGKGITLDKKYDITIDINFIEIP